MMHKTTSDTPHGLEISGSLSVTGTHFSRSCSTAIFLGVARAAVSQLLDQLRSFPNDSAAVDAAVVLASAAHAGQRARFYL